VIQILIPTHVLIRILIPAQSQIATQSPNRAWRPRPKPVWESAQARVIAAPAGLRRGLV
jgi:hypothetical protein